MLQVKSHPLTWEEHVHSITEDPDIDKEIREIAANIHNRQTTLLEVLKSDKYEEDVALQLINLHLYSDINKVEKTSYYSSDEDTYLHVAARKGYRKAVRLLLKKGARLDLKNGHHKTPLDEAFNNDDYTTFSYLIRKTEKRQIFKINYQKILIEDFIELLDTENINSTTAHEWTPLYMAVFQGRLDLAECLIEKGADVNNEDDQGHANLLPLAITQKRRDIANLLIEHGADVNAKGKSGATPLYLAIACERIDIVSLLIRCSARANCRLTKIPKKTIWSYNDCGSTPLHKAAEKGMVEIASLLIEQGARINSKTLDETTPLHLATKHSRTKVLQLLIKHGADVNAQDKRVDTPLHLATKSEIAEILIKSGADVNIPDNNGDSALHLACEKAAYDDEALKIALLLIKNGANVNAQNERRMTPIFTLCQGLEHYLAKGNHAIELTNVLLSHGADISIDSYGTTPLEKLRRIISTSKVVKNMIQRLEEHKLLT